MHLRVADLRCSRAFYAVALEPLGIPLLLDAPDLVQVANLPLSAETALSNRHSGRLVIVRAQRIWGLGAMIVPL